MLLKMDVQLSGLSQLFSGITNVLIWHLRAP